MRRRANKRAPGCGNIPAPVTDKRLASSWDASSFGSKSVLHVYCAVDAAVKLSARTYPTMTAPVWHRAPMREGGAPWQTRE
jgi:hypothetical protein